MDLQESTLYDLEVKVTQNVAKYHPHHVTYAPANFKVAMSNGLGEMHLQENTLFDLGSKVKVT